MSAIARLRIFAGLALALVMAIAPRADACSCGMHKGTREEQVLEALNEAGVVFVARLRTSTLSPDKEYPDMVHEDAQFVIIEVLKGPLVLGQPILVQQILREFVKHPPKWPLEPGPPSTP